MRNTYAYICIGEKNYFLMEVDIKMKKILSFVLTVLLCVGVLTACGGNQESSGASETTDASQTGPQSGIKTVKASMDDLVATARDEDFNYGYINTKGEWVIAPQYESALPFSDGVAAVYNENVKPHVWQIIDKSGKVVATFNEDIQVYTGSNNGYNRNSVLLAFLEDGYQASRAYISEDMLIISDKAGKKYGFATVAGKVVVKPKYTSVGAFCEGLAAVNFGTVDDKKWGYIDKQGNTVIAGQYKEAHAFSCGLAYVEPKTDEGSSAGCFIDQKGQLVIDEKEVGYDPTGGGRTLWKGFHSFGSDFVNDLAVCAYSTGKANENPRLAVINKSGVAVWIDTDEKYWTPLSLTIGDGLFNADLLGDDNDQTGFLDTSGAVTIVFKSGWDFKSFFSGGLCKFTDVATGKYGYIDRSGAAVIPAKYAVATPYLNDYAVVSTDGQTYSYIDTKGNTVAAGEYKNASMPFTK